LEAGNMVKTFSNQDYVYEIRRDSYMSRRAFI